MAVLWQSHGVDFSTPTSLTHSPWGSLSLIRPRADPRGFRSDATSWPMRRSTDSPVKQHTKCLRNQSESLKNHSFQVSHRFGFKKRTLGNGKLIVVEPGDDEDAYTTSNKVPYY